MIISELSVQQIFKYLTAANWQLIFIYLFFHSVAGPDKLWPGFSQSSPP